MPQKNPTHLALERLLAIDWQLNNDSDVASNVASVREYLRRAALWAKATGCTEEWPFFDVAAHIRPSVRLFSFEESEVLRQHFAHLPFYLNLTIRQTCEWYLHWTALQSSPHAISLALPEPYSPLIRMYERGGQFYREHNFLYVASRAVFVGSWRKYDRSKPSKHYLMR